ncbi:hypothetical protein NCAS_0B03880 [Naumovozyma castellii]|uniref:Trafficking protein particle complex III-specific subunit 85 n=1 Tax=Naumovozyma castellii TaxID=27288 RepID=G0V9Y7_NAUCA|nr:hypothetical protein NCAS_0B03880 [Naumovozyma castellii CBS 4309]CCC68472.1 hypothetical protein NCAS_0B03880 [Naumovozyma castellii CBS 4309]
MNFSYEHYMNLLFHLDYGKETVPSEIAKRIVSNAISPVIAVTSTSELDHHILETYNIDSLYMLLRFFSGCVSDRDQANELEKSQKDKISSNNTLTLPTTSPLPKVRTRGRSRSNSLFQRDSTQSQYIRFTKPLGDVIATKNANDMLFDYHSLEIYLQNYLDLIQKNTDDNTPYELLKKSIYHSFFSLAISSTTILSPYECFNHPVVSLIAVDISLGQNYDDVRDLLVDFKNLNSSTHNFPIFMNTNDMLPVVLLCYDDQFIEQFETCQALTKKIKKQLFVECISLPLWKDSYPSDPQVHLHQPVMSSLEEMIYFLNQPKEVTLPYELIQSIYNILDSLVYNLMIPFMKRKIAFWDETILQPRKSLFHGAKFLKKFMTKTALTHQENLLTKDAQGNEYFTSASSEFLMRKLADWSMMLSDFKTAYATYESLTHDLESFPKYSASCLEWCAVSLLMGAQNIVTVKMLKNDINPLIEKALSTYENCATVLPETDKRNTDELIVVPVRSYETRCMILASELFLSLSDTWTSTPYAISYLETILVECKLGACSQIMIWERLSDCYELRVDPRIKHKAAGTIANTSSPKKSSESDMQGHVMTPSPLTKEDVSNDANNDTDQDIVSKGFTRKRKAAFFRLMAAKKWAEQKRWRQVSWCLQSIDDTYSKIGLADRDDLILKKIQNKLKTAETETIDAGAEKNAEVSHHEVDSPN